MSTIDLPTATVSTKTQTDETLTSEIQQQGSLITVEHCLYVLLGIVALIAHVWGLGDRSLHHDETLHATYSWYIYSGRGYIHDPLLHGPFLYYFGALLFFLFGDNDFTARLGAALFGTILVVLPFFIRRELGRTAALLASVYLLISPAFLYMGRFIRHDMYSIVFEMLVFVAIVRYANTRQPRWLYVGVAAFSLMMANQETSYLYVLLMGTPLILVLLWRTYKPGIAILGGLGVALAVLVFVLPGTAQVDGAHNAIRDAETEAMQYTPGPLFGWSPLETADNAYALRIRNQPDNDGGRSLLENIGAYIADLWLFFRHPAILLGIAFLLGSIVLLAWMIWFHRAQDGMTNWQRAQAKGDGVLPIYASLLADRRLVVALAILFSIYALLFTAFLSNIIGLISGTTGSLLYWLAQHNVERGGQPSYYYVVLLAIYEPLLLLLAGIGLLMVGKELGARWWRAWRKRQLDTEQLDVGIGVDEVVGGNGQPSASATTKTYGSSPSAFTPILLAWWSIGALGIYSWAGEKMPWLVVHIMLPMVLLAAWACQRILTGYRPQPVTGSPFDSDDNPPASPVPFMIFGGIFVSIAGLAFILMTTYVRSSSEMSLIGIVVPLLALVLVALLVVFAGVYWGWRWALGTLVVCTLFTGGLYTVRNAYRLSYQNGDVPREMMIYTQTSPDVMRVVRNLEEASRRRGGGLDISIFYDNETIWQWYFRDFPQATNVGTQLTTPPGPEIQAVFMLQENLNADPQTRGYLEDGFRVHRMPLRWWFPEDDMYRLRSDWRTAPVEDLSLLGSVLRAPFYDETVVEVWQYLLDRETNAALGSTDFVIAVRPELADQIGLGIGGQLGGQ